MGSATVRTVRGILFPSLGQACLGQCGPTAPCCSLGSGVQQISVYLQWSVMAPSQSVPWACQCCREFSPGFAVAEVNQPPAQSTSPLLTNQLKTNFLLSKMWSNFCGHTLLTPWKDQRQTLMLSAWLDLPGWGFKTFLEKSGDHYGYPLTTLAQPKPFQKAYHEEEPEHVALNTVIQENG